MIRYCAPAEHSLVRQVGLLYAVFDRLSGRTHLITDVAFAILQAANDPGSTDELCGRVRQVSDFDAEAGADIDATLRSLVDELHTLDLLKLVS
jgi:PqqD family protein of HPr-rel-A system